MNRRDKLAIGLAVIFEVISIISAINSFLTKNRRTMLLSILAIVCFTIPFIISAGANKKKIKLPHGFNVEGTLFIFGTQYLGEVQGFYLKYWWWDLLMHGSFGILTVIILLNINQGIIKKGPHVTEKRYKFLNKIYALSLSIALGTLWEIFEYAGDVFFKTNMVKGGLEDTITDILIHIIAALITVIFYRTN